MFCYNNNSNINSSPFFAPQPSVSPFGFSRSASASSFGNSSFGNSSFGSHSPFVSATTPLPPTSGFIPCANHNPFPFGNGGYGSNNNDGDTVMKHETFGDMEFEIVDGDTIMECVDDDNSYSYYCIDGDGDAIMSDMDWE